jgi:hypothetical protein
VYRAAERSIDHPDFRPVYGWVGVHNWFAFMFSRIGDYPRAANSFRVLGRFVAAEPWWGDKLAQFRSFRDKALAGG